MNFIDYRLVILALFMLIIGVIIHGLLALRRANKRLKLRTQKYEALSVVSNEIFYEFDLASEELQVVTKCWECQEHFSTCEEYMDAINVLKEKLKDFDPASPYLKIKYKLANGQLKCLNSINTVINDEDGQPKAIIGKLVDNSQEAAELEQLLIKAQIDGLTNLYNAETTKEFITERINSRPSTELDILILIDCDNFKTVNDTYGHLRGNQLLNKLGELMIKQYRRTDILGRIGGDEFAIYMKAVPSITFAKEKTQILINSIKEEPVFEKASISAGLATVKSVDTYDSVFQKADQALYKAKNSGKSRIVVYAE